MAVVTLPESHRRLGRHVERDDRSWGFPAPRSTGPLTTVLHRRLVPPFDQGNLGSCTGNAMAGVLMTEPVHTATIGILAEKDAVALYEAATQLDGVPGSYPPDDTGSSGLAVAKAARKRGLISGYKHAFGLDHALHALMLRPVLIGIPWYDSFDAPGQDGMIAISPNAGIRGGHEVELLGLMVIPKAFPIVRGPNSWGLGWGDHGYFQMTADTLDRLLHESGDVMTVH